MKYKYSVIIPVYNAELTLRRCVDSLLRQNYHAAEIILINDGSTDHSGLICQEYVAAYDCVRYIEQSNAGASTARNSGLDAASGTFITFVDSDDYVLDGYFITLDQSEADFTIFEHKAIRNDGVHDISFSQNLMTSDTDFDLIYHVLQDRLVAPWTKKYRRSVIKENEIRFKPELIIGEDFLFCLEYMLCCKSCCAINHPIYCVDETGMDSITRSARYDYSQFILVYRYAFPMVESSKRQVAEKEKLIQILDYLYCRTVFARTSYCIQEKNDPYKRAVSLIHMFQKDYRRKVRPMNIIHRVMQWCVKHGVVPVFFAAGYAHNLNQKCRKKAGL